MAETFEYARALILEKVTALPAESVPLLEAVGRVLAADVRAPWDLPRWDNSAMDGFAVRAEDCQSSQPLLIDGYIPAGSTAEGISVSAGKAVRIMTGAPVPAGCDTIVPIEETEEQDQHVLVKGPVRVGDHIRVRGEDVQQNEVVLSAGSVLRSAAINMLASFGFSAVAVFGRPKVAILSTGDELVELGEQAGPGQIINSNAYSLAAAVLELGGEPLLGLEGPQPGPELRVDVAGQQFDGQPELNVPGARGEREDEEPEPEGKPPAEGAELQPRHR